MLVCARKSPMLSHQTGDFAPEINDWRVRSVNLPVVGQPTSLVSTSLAQLALSCSR